MLDDHSRSGSIDPGKCPVKCPGEVSESAGLRCVKCGDDLQLSIYDLDPVDYLYFVCARCDPPKRGIRAAITTPFWMITH